METVNVYKILGKRALVTRESARALRSSIASAAAENKDLGLEFEGVDAVTPSFVDEIMGIVDEVMPDRGRERLRLVFLHAPTRLSEKFAAIGRGRHLDITESDEGTWVVTGPGPEPLPKAQSAPS
ncbi:MAG: DUF4325 domain-containing protein [Dehalococcoidia bacterium]|nr:DUF4325 domain-containing protein [Dehalococcoidia bacterium]